MEQVTLLSSDINCHCIYVKAALDEKVMVAIPGDGVVGEYSLQNQDLMATNVQFDMRQFNDFDDGMECHTIQLEISKEPLVNDELEKVFHLDHFQISCMGDCPSTKYSGVFKIADGNYLKIYLAGKFNPSVDFGGQ